MQEVRVPPHHARQVATGLVTPRSPRAAVPTDRGTGPIRAGLLTETTPDQVPVERAPSAWADEIGRNLRGSTTDAR